jgi:hypothetical protein
MSDIWYDAELTVIRPGSPGVPGSRFRLTASISLTAPPGYEESVRQAASVTFRGMGLDRIMEMPGTGYVLTIRPREQ